MPRIVFRAADGGETVVDAPTGHSVMEVAVDNQIPGMVAECGGACACATCHVYVAPEWLERVPPMDDMEDAMLDAALDRRDSSRLGCQLEITDAMDGLTVTVADNDG